MMLQGAHGVGCKREGQARSRCIVGCTARGSESSEVSTLSRRQLLNTASSAALLAAVGALGLPSGSRADSKAVAVMGDQYQRDTRKLLGDIETYLSLSGYDKERIKLVASLQKDSNTWAADYAPGGSARKFSARTCYRIVDQVTGHLRANGLAAFPKKGVAQLEKDIAEAYLFLNEEMGSQ